MSWQGRRMEVFERDRGICRACGLKVGKRWHVDHLQARVRAGQDELDNLALMHPWCNLRKPIMASPEDAQVWIDEQQHPSPVDWRPIWDLMR